MTNSKELIKETQHKMDKAQSVLENDLGQMRAGRANASILKPVSVEYYGTQTPLNQVASISIPEPRIMMITPYDKSSLKDIERGILEADLGLNPMNDGDNIRIEVPQLTEERRKEIAKKAKAIGEQSKVAIRNVRRDSMDIVKRNNKNDDINDDEAHELENQIQKLTNNAINGIDKIVKEKQEALMKN
ncbi:ribosome recycling factor [Fructilactobacillus lindneri]|uniref:Ribosome-recycling factor n=2 Tax=Fructilactobacillus lindneri TaxID=53444 RepID=A0A0R2JP61_9LACO|nr:ribosome recycling factor [Fructilactobacillus lindneri]ANZ58097.1 ribosome recycling factor [Fructilactobacillus lindneri]ANZ59418.1 ribosome recycling factor [Fructilactobacillus lindneri]KRN78914.1 ribosome-recycling factor [Fructilactobacillus lindneri DSM 20690 = JCM 11027]POG98798.1 ribosome recycling factor [Fructilactobacillus lindneri]POH03071.1 ribosome recycling factor [Fructilactobacillus lindneri]